MKKQISKRWMKALLNSTDQNIWNLKVQIRNEESTVYRAKLLEDLVREVETRTLIQAELDKTTAFNRLRKFFSLTI